MLAEYIVGLIDNRERDELITKKVRNEQNVKELENNELQ